MLGDLAAALKAIVSQRLLRSTAGGRVPAVEVLLNSRFISELIENGDIPGVREAMDKSLAEGSQMFEADIARLIGLGLVTQEEGLLGADSPTNLLWRLQNDMSPVSRVQAVKAEFGLLIGRNAARSLKMVLGLADGAAEWVDTVGIDAARRTPRVEHVPAWLVASALAQPIGAIAGMVQEMMSDIPPNLAEDVVRGKIRLAGGGALLPGLASKIEAATDIPAVVVDDPLRCVVRGAAEFLERMGDT